jgi:MFS family permease
MDLTPYIGWIVFFHVLGAFAFAAGHGVSMFVAFQIRRDRDRERLEALLDLSGWSLGLAGVGLLAILVFGILAGIVLGSWDRAWLWISLVLFIAIAGAMTPIGSGYFSSARLALGQRTRNLKAADPDPVPVSDAELDKVLESKRPELLLTIGAGGFTVILWLMMFKP